MTEFNLSLYDYCDEDDTHTARGNLNYQPDLIQLAERGEELHGRVIHMEELDTLVVLAEGPTIHIHADGKLVLNGISSLQEANTLIQKLINTG